MLVPVESALTGIDTSTQRRVYVASEHFWRCDLPDFSFAPRILSSSFYVGDAGNTSLVDAGTPLGATTVVTPGVLVIYFGSAASWRPCNVVWPHQGPVSHS